MEAPDVCSRECQPVYRACSWHQRNHSNDQNHSDKKSLSKWEDGDWRRISHYWGLQASFSHPEKDLGIFSLQKMLLYRRVSTKELVIFNCGVWRRPLRVP